MTAQLRGEINATAAQLHGEINAAVNKMLLAQIATAGLLFAAIKLFGGARVAPRPNPGSGASRNKFKNYWFFIYARIRIQAGRWFLP